RCLARGITRRLRRRKRHPARLLDSRLRFDHYRLRFLPRADEATGEAPTPESWRGANERLLPGDGSVRNLPCQAPSAEVECLTRNLTGPYGAPRPSAYSFRRNFLSDCTADQGNILLGSG